MLQNRFQFNQQKQKEESEWWQEQLYEFTRSKQVDVIAVRKRKIRKCFACLFIILTCLSVGFFVGTFKNAFLCRLSSWGIPWFSTDAAVEPPNSTAESANSTVASKPQSSGRTNSAIESPNSAIGRAVPTNDRRHGLSNLDTADTISKP